MQFRLSPRLRFALPTALGLIALTAPAPADAAVTGSITVTHSGSALTITGSASGSGGGVEVAIDNGSITSSLPVLTPDGTCDALPSGGTATCMEDFATATIDFSGMTVPISAGIGELVTSGGTATVTLGAQADWADSTGTHQLTINGGGGPDLISTGLAPVTLNGGPGNDILSSGTPIGSTSTVNGEDGNDFMGGGPGRDIFDGGADAGDGRGDTVSYYRRFAPVSVTLPAASVAIPAGGNGVAGEDDRIAHVESARGGFGDDTLVGNDDGNTLTGAEGADTLDGAGGDDVLEARVTQLLPFAPFADVDTRLDCGGGADRVSAEDEDPAAIACEHAEPGVRRPVIQGTPRAGEQLSLTPLSTWGDPGTGTITWTKRTPDLSGLGFYTEEIGTGASIVLRATDVGSTVFAGVEIADDHDDVFSAYANPVGPVARTADPEPVPPPQPPTPPFSERARTLAQQALGVPVVTVAGALPGGCLLFAPASGATSLSLRRQPTGVLAVTCDHAITGTARTRVTLAPKARRGRSRVLVLPSQRVRLTGEGAATVTFKVGTVQRRAIRAARSANAVLSVSVGDSTGPARTITRRYRITR